MSFSLREQIRALDQQIVALIAERTNLTHKALEEDDASLDAETEAEMVSDWEEAADEHALPVGGISSLAKFVLKLCRVSGE